MKRVLNFPDADNCGEVYVSVLTWLHFPFIEAFNLNFKWFFLLGFKYWIMISMFVVLCLPFWVFQKQNNDYLCLILSIPACFLCCIGAWLQLVTFENKNNLRVVIKDLIKIFIMCFIVFSIIYVIIYFNKNHNDIHKNFDGEDLNILNILLASIFIVVLICIELRIIHSWHDVNVRYHYFGWQLLASIIIVMIMFVLELNMFAFASIFFVLYNAAIIWNDLMHKKIMQTTYGLNKAQYVDKYRPIYNTDKDSEWLTKIFTICCSKEQCINKCRGRWVINCYAGLVTGRITTPTYLL